MKRKDANLRVCASCEFIFLQSESPDCPKCGFGHYGARFVYGNRAYRYAKTQEPWIKLKMDEYYFELLAELRRTETSQPVVRLRRSIYENH